MILFDIETTGLNPIKSTLLTIQIKKDSETKIWKLWEEQDEVALIKKFLEFLKTVNEPLVGYCINGFDLSFVLSKLAVNNQLTDEIVQLISSKKWVDLTQFQENSYGLDNWLEELAIPRQSDVKGRHIPTLYDLKQYDKIVEHAVDDLNACEKIIQKLNLKI